jgi:hypothetical protein
MTQPQQQQIQIKASDEAVKGVYANMVQVMHTGEEFVMDFLSVYPPAGSLNARVIVSPSHMKRLVAALADNLAKYEKQFGAVKASDAPTTAPIGFDARV